MSKFNKGKEKITTHEGGRGYQRDLLKQWLNFMMGSRIEPGFYEDGSYFEKQLKDMTLEIINTYGAKYAAKVAVFSRDILGMRSVSQYVAAILNNYKFDGKRNFYARFFSRPDDVAEVFAIIETCGWKRSHGLIRGAADYLSGLNEYSLGKYKMARKNFNMYDLINITHAHSSTIDQLKNGTLETPDTWEVAISACEDSESRNQEWIRLLLEGKLGYMALLRNLRNICIAYAMETDSRKEEILAALEPQLTDEAKIRGSKVFPYRIYTAYQQLKWDVYGEFEQSFFKAITPFLEKAFIIATDNVPEFEGRNVVILDVSGSMNQPISSRSVVSVLQASACQAFTMILRNPNTGIIKFGTSAKVSVKYSNAGLSPFEYISYLCDSEGCGYGTCLDSVISIVELMDGEIDRFFLYSDMQVMGKRSCYGVIERKSFNAWLCNHRNTYLYSYDLGQYGESCVSDSDQFMFISALNDAIYELIPYFEEEDGVGKFIDKMQL